VIPCCRRSRTTADTADQPNEIRTNRRCYIVTVHYLGKLHRATPLPLLVSATIGRGWCAIEYKPQLHSLAEDLLRLL